jgi:hypothetical protein
MSQVEIDLCSLIHMLQHNPNPTRDVVQAIFDITRKPGTNPIQN